MSKNKKILNKFYTEQEILSMLQENSQLNLNINSLNVKGSYRCQYGNYMLEVEVFEVDKLIVRLFDNENRISGLEFNKSNYPKYNNAYKVMPNSFNLLNFFKIGLNKLSNL